MNIIWHTQKSTKMVKYQLGNSSSWNSFPFGRYHWWKVQISGQENCMTGQNGLAGQGDVCSTRCTKGIKQSYCSIPTTRLSALSIVQVALWMAMFFILFIFTTSAIDEWPTRGTLFQGDPIRVVMGGRFPMQRLPLPSGNLVVFIDTGISLWKVICHIRHQRKLEVSQHYQSRLLRKLRNRTKGVKLSCLCERHCR